LTLTSANQGNFTSNERLLAFISGLEKYPCSIRVRPWLKNILFAPLPRGQVILVPDFVAPGLIRVNLWFLKSA
jgi:hypothetical protein